MVDSETGEKRRVESTKRVQPWWWSDGSKVHICIRYGAKPIEFAKGKNAIEVDSAADVVSTLELVKQAVTAGELDAQIDAASAKLREGFVIGASWELCGLLGATGKVSPPLTLSSKQTVP